MNQATPISVLIVEDSRSARMLLAHLLGADPAIQVAGAVENGRQAIEFLANAAPDVILMDIEMPEMNGLEATRRIMETRPTPIVICSASADPRQADTTIRSLEAGALACVEKPVGIEHPDFPRVAANLLETVKLMSEIKVVRRWPTRRPGVAGALEPFATLGRSAGRIEVVGIGASTGGPPVLQTILSSLPADWPAPILVVQHISLGFLPSLTQWLAKCTPLTVQIAADGMGALPGNVYFAPDHFHLTIAPGARINLNSEPPDNGLRPSVARLFDSMARVCGATAAGVILTGMGKDGALELLALKNRGAFTIAQDRQTSVVHGMPGAAIALGAASRVLPADKIAAALISLIRQDSFPGETYECVNTKA